MRTVKFRLVQLRLSGWGSVPSTWGKKAELADRGVEEGLPFGVVRRLQIETHGDVHLDIGHIDGMKSRRDDRHHHGGQGGGGVGGEGAGGGVLADGSGHCAEYRWRIEDQSDTKKKMKTRER